MLNGDEFFLNLAINEAWKYQGLTYPNPAVGCVITNEYGKILSIQSHKKAGHAHAELSAVKEALGRLNPDFIFPKETNELYHFIIANHNNLLKNAHVYVTLEPCNHQGKTPPCSGLLEALHVKKVVIGSMDENEVASGGAKRLKNAKIDLKQGVLKQECDKLIYPFLRWNKQGFSFFKVGMSLNGVIKGGIITSQAARTHVHSLRDKTDLLVIGGNTVRVDRPTLDARMVSGKAPDVLIYSQKNNFDTDIPLFHVPNREVFIQNSLAKAKEYGFVMYEGGEGLMNAVSNEMDWFLIYQSPKFLENENLKTSLKLKPIWQGRIENDSYSWYERA